MGWMEAILSITKNIGETNKAKEDLLSNYGIPTLEQVVASEKQYIDGESCFRQDRYMLYKCLMT